MQSQISRRYNEAGNHKKRIQVVSLFWAFRARNINGYIMAGECIEAKNRSKMKFY